MARLSPDGAVGQVFGLGLARKSIEERDALFMQIKRLRGIDGDRTAKLVGTGAL